MSAMEPIVVEPKAVRRWFRHGLRLDLAGPIYWAGLFGVIFAATAMMYHAEMWIRSAVLAAVMVASMSAALRLPSYVDGTAARGLVLLTIFWLVYFTLTLVVMVAFFAIIPSIPVERVLSVSELFVDSVKTTTGALMLWLAIFPSSGMDVILGSVIGDELSSREQCARGIEKNGDAFTRLRTISMVVWLALGFGYTAVPEVGLAAFLVLPLFASTWYAAVKDVFGGGLEEPEKQRVLVPSEQT